MILDTSGLSALSSGKYSIKIADFIPDTPFLCISSDSSTSYAKTILTTLEERMVYLWLLQKNWIA